MCIEKTFVNFFKFHGVNEQSFKSSGKLPRNDRYARCEFDVKPTFLKSMKQHFYVEDQIIFRRFQKMLEYWMPNNDTPSNGSEFEIEEVIEHPGSAILFVGYPSWLLYFAATCCILFMLIGIPGNLVTIAALFRTKKLRNATAVFIMNLSISDLMFCCFNLPLATSTFWHSSWLHGPLLCRLFPLLRYGLVAVSLFTVLAITINRYVMIGHPKIYPKLYKPKYLILMVLATWISGFGALVATWFEQWGRFGLDPAIGSCSILPDTNGRSPKEFLFILAFLTPCIAIIVCYARIFFIVRKTALKSRRRNKVTIDLVKASIDVKYTKNFEDSAIGSSCGATITTTENGCSPTKDFSNSFIISSPNIIHNHNNDQSPGDENNYSPVERKSVCSLSFMKNLKTNKNPKESITSENPSVNEASSSRRNSESDANESFSCRLDETSENIENCSTIGIRDDDSIGNAGNDRPVIPDLRIQGEKLKFEESEENSQLSSDDEIEEIDNRSNFERSVEFLPFIDTCIDSPQGIEDDSVLSNTANVVSHSIPDLRFFEADSPREKSDTDRQPIADVIRQDCCLQVPKRYSRIDNSGNQTSSIRSMKIGLEIHSSQDSKRNQILNTKNLEENIICMPKKYLDIKRNTEFLCPRKYANEISDEYASSRSDSPSDRQSFSKSIFRRESRFRSIRNRAFESGKMTTKDKKLLKMILVIFLSFVVCYLPITITKIFKNFIDWRELNIAGYILIYLTTCINPVIYVVMSSEYRCAYKNFLLCRSESNASNCKRKNRIHHHEKKMNIRERKKGDND